MEDLSPRQREMLEFISATIDQRGIAPTYREIGNALGIGSTNGVSDHIKSLIRKGYLERAADRGSPRSLVPTDRAFGRFKSQDVVTSVHILGRIAAGQPLLAEENYEGTLRLDSSMLPAGGKVFALIVTGESMIDDGIRDGDYLFVREQHNARNGEIAVVMVDGQATVKRFYKENGRIRLQPANQAMAPIYLEDNGSESNVIGVAVGVWRQVR